MTIFGVLLGFLIFGGLLAWHAVFLIQPAGAVSPGPATDYRNAVYALGWATAILMDFAVALAVSMAWVIGMTKNEVPQSTRTGLLVFAAIFLAIWIISSAAFFSLFRYPPLAFA